MWPRGNYGRLSKKFDKMSRNNNKFLTMILMLCSTIRDYIGITTLWFSLKLFDTIGRV